MKEGALAAIGWERLRGEGAASAAELGIPSLEVGASTGAGPVRIALGTDGAAMLLLPIASGDAFPAVVDTAGLEVRDSVLLLRGRPVRFAELVCREGSLEEVFRRLVADIIRRLAAGSAPAEAVEDAVADFRALLLAGTRRPTAEAALGLIGELLVLNQLLAVSDAAAETWTGPLGGRHDFRNGNIAAEVKTSLRAQRRTVEISAIDQMMAPEEGELMLVHHVLEHDTGGLLNVADEAERAIGRAADPDELRDRLAAVGFVTELRDRWSSFRFSHLSTLFYRVEDAFPRLTSASFPAGKLPKGVSHVRYRIDLDLAEEFRLSPAEVEHCIGRLCA